MSPLEYEIPNKMSFQKEEKALLNLYKDQIDAAAENLYEDTTKDKGPSINPPPVRPLPGPAGALGTAMAGARELNSRLKYGIVRCDYEYTPTRGDPGDPKSFSFGAETLKVEGWTFEAVQRGISEDGIYPASEFRLKDANGKVDEYGLKNWEHILALDGSRLERSGFHRVTEKPTGDKYTEGYFEEGDYTHGEVYRYEPDAIEKNMKAAIKALEDCGVCGITADVGYSQAFQDNVRTMASVPVALSSLQQLSFVAQFYDLRRETGNMIMVMTANSESFDRDLLIPPGVDPSCIKVLGTQASSFGRWVATGESFSRFKDKESTASVEEAMKSMADECQRGIDEVKKAGGNVVCIVQECAEMPAYSNGLRKRFKLPVYDTMTAINFVQMGQGFTGYSAFMM